MSERSQLIEEEDRTCPWCGVYVHDEEQLKSPMLPPIHRWCVSDLVIAGIRALKRELREAQKPTPEPQS